MLWLLGALLLQPSQDPRIPIVELTTAKRFEEALEATERELATDPQGARALGFDHLRGHLLAALGKHERASAAFADALSTAPSLRSFSRFRLAEMQVELGHPEVAAGLLATLLGRDPPETLIPEATDLLVRSISGGGDCRLLVGLDGWTLPQPFLRRLRLTQGECAARSGEIPRARAVLESLLEERTDDETARLAAQRLAALPQPTGDRQLLLLLGRTFHFHREFERSTLYFSMALEEPAAAIGAESYEDRYALARGFFWRGHFRTAAAEFSSLGAAVGAGERRAQALYQAGRSEELSGDWTAAARTFLDSHAAAPTSRWAGPALLSALRLQWRMGRQEEALVLFGSLSRQARWSSLTRQAALFAVSSEIVRGRPREAADWLFRSGGPSQETRPHFQYWRGRLAELEGRRREAVQHYLELLRSDPFHPLALDSRQRLDRSELAGLARLEGLRRLEGRETTELLEAWLLLRDGDEGETARRALLGRLASQGRLRPYLELTSVPVAAWPLWRARLETPDEQLLALGIWQAGETVVLRHFPMDEPDLAFTASLRLASEGLHRRALHVAEVLARKVPPQIPSQLLPDSFRRLLYPFPYRGIILEQAGAHQVDPFLIAAVIREESRFDPTAVSPASARGLTQFILPTARRLADKLGLELRAADLARPEPAIALGAAYLAELSLRFKGHGPAMVAAYNAGESQAQLWHSYCYSRDPAEYYTKVGFPETVGYLDKVLASREQYRELYSDVAPRGSEPAVEAES